MDANIFESAKLLLSEEGFQVTQARYHAREFGSWYIVANATPPVRILWDGKDGWLVVQTQSDESLKSPPEWVDAWIERDRERQTLANLIRRIHDLAEAPRAHAADD